MGKWGAALAQPKKKKKKSGGNSAGGNYNSGTILNAALVIGMGVIGVFLIMEVFGDLITNNNLDPYIGLEIILSIIPTILALTTAVSGGLTGFIGYKGGTMSLKEAMMTPLVMIIAAVMVPFLMAVVEEALGSQYIANFIAIEISLSIILTVWSLGMMALAGALMMGSKKRHLG